MTIRPLGRGVYRVIIPCQGSEVWLFCELLNEPGEKKRLRGFLFSLLCLFDQFQEALDFRFGGRKHAIEFFLGVMVCQEPMNIHSPLPAPSDPSAGKTFIHDPAVFEGNRVAQLRAANRFVIMFFDQLNPPSEQKGCTRRTNRSLRVHRWKTTQSRFISYKLTLRS